MEGATKIGVLCDLHLNGDKKSPQYAFLECAVEQMRSCGVDKVICLGDVTAYGEVAGYYAYHALMKEFDHYEVIGNSDVRDFETAEIIHSMFHTSDFRLGNRKVIGIHTPYGRIEAKDREKLQAVHSGDVIYLHHDLPSLEEDSRRYLEELAANIPVTIVHGHTHKRIDYTINDSSVVGAKCLDPDKCIGGFPCVTYLDIHGKEISITEQPITIPTEAIADVERFFGLSCADNRADVTYALERSIKRIELRCIDGWTPDWTLLPLIQQWREKTKGYLSVHMPDIRIKNGVVVGKEQWYQAVEYAIAVKADGLTMHPPRVRKTDIPHSGEKWNEILDLYADAVAMVGNRTRVGIENLHVNKGEKVDANRGFGYVPEEVTSWISSLEAALGVCNRVGHVLDVGHARNNGSLAELYPISRWYEIMGKRTVAYHIHQVVPDNEGYRNHYAIENWFGPMINYTSFFYSWQNGLLNHVPVFLEVKGHANFEKSIQGLKSLKEEVQTHE